MKLTRDSALWTVLIIGAVLAYLGTMPPPTQWTYTQWVQSLSALVAAIAGGPRNAWLPGENDAAKKDKVDLSKIGLVLLAAVLAGGSLPGCAGKSVRHEA